MNTPTELRALGAATSTGGRRRTLPLSTSTMIWSLTCAVLGAWWLINPDAYVLNDVSDRPTSLMMILPTDVGAFLFLALGLMGAGLAHLLERDREGAASRRVLLSGGATLAVFFGVVGPDLQLLSVLGYATAILGGPILAGILIVGAPRHHGNLLALLVMTSVVAIGIAAGEVGAPTLELLGKVGAGLGRVGARPLVLAFMLTGGLLFAASTFSAARGGVGGERPLGARSQERLQRWGRRATIVAALCPLPYGLLRMTWATPWPQGLGGEEKVVLEGGVRVFGLCLGLAALGGAWLTLGLISRWGEVWPAWLPRLRGRPVPVLAAVVPAAVVAMTFCAASISLIVIAVRGGDPWLVVMIPAPVWGPALALATYAYYRRRTDPVTAAPEPYRVLAGEQDHGRRGGDVPVNRQLEEVARRVTGRDPGGRSVSVPRLSRARRTVRVLLTLIVAVGAGAGAVVGAAAVTAEPILFLTVGLVVTLGLAAAGLWSALRGLPRRQRVRLTLAVVGALAVGSAASVLSPLPDSPDAPDRVRGQSVWQLATGSRLAYVKLPGVPPIRTTPIVVLHGGPGVSDMPGDAEFFGALTGLGFDVYVYDQLGSGRSSRLADPRGYGIDRDVADLEAIRRTIEADQMVLIGHSYGGALAAHYVATHPDRVSRLILSSPGPLDPADTSGDRATARLGLRSRLDMYVAALAPRSLLGYTLLQVNPAAAHAYFGDREADARNDTIISIAEPALHCNRDQARGPVLGSGFYALQYPQSGAAPPRPDVRATLAGHPVPALIVKGSCDYLSWQSAVDYRRALPDSTLLYLEGAGHNTYQDRPGLVVGAIRGFLTDGPLPIAPYEALTPPPSYLGDG